MRIATRVPDPAAVTLERIVADGASVTLVVRAQRARVPCPCCEHIATRVHSRYTRQPAIMWTVQCAGARRSRRTSAQLRALRKEGKRCTSNA